MLYNFLCSDHNSCSSGDRAETTTSETPHARDFQLCISYLSGGVQAAWLYPFPDITDRGIGLLSEWIEINSEIYRCCSGDKWASLPQTVRAAPSRGAGRAGEGGAWRGVAWPPLRTVVYPSPATPTCSLHKQHFPPRRRNGERQRGLKDITREGLKLFSRRDMALVALVLLISRSER